MHIVENKILKNISMQQVCLNYHQLWMIGPVEFFLLFQLLERQEQ